MAELRTEFLFQLSAQLEEPQDLGATPRGDRRILYVASGKFDGPELKR